MKKTMKLNVLLVTSILTVFSCSKTLNMDFMQVEDKVSVRSEDEATRTLGSLKTKKIIQLLKKRKWTSTPATYVPGTVFFAKNYSINITSNFIVINFKDKDGKWNQYISNEKLTEKEEEIINGILSETD